MGREHREPLPLFGRATHLQYLRQRAAEPGLTAIVGRPKQGKSYLLRVLRKQLAADGVLTGCFEANKTQTDTVLYAVSDLYDSWLTDSNWRQQAKTLLERHKADFTGVAAAVGDILLEAAKDLHVPLAGTARKVFEKLLRADRDVKTGGLDLPPLTNDQAMQILQPLHTITGKPIVLIFDAWERTGRVTEDTQFLESFLDHWRDWPPMHVLVACREHTDDGERFAPPGRFADRSVRAQRWELPAMELGEDGDARGSLLTYLHSWIPCTNEMPDSQIIGLVGGYPGVLMAWSDSPTTPQTVAELEELAIGAQQLRYDRLLNVDLPGLLDGGAAGGLFRVLARLAMLPELNSAEAWDQLKPVVLAGLPDGASLLNQLTSRGLLVSDSSREDPDIPRFGHTTEYDAARGWFLRDNRAVPHTRSEAEGFLVHLASAIGPIDDEDIFCGIALAGSASIIDTLGLDARFESICAAAATLCGSQDDRTRNQLLPAAQSAGAMTPSVRPLLVAALLHSLNDAKEADDGQRRDAMLDRLRGLCLAHGDDPTVRKFLARGLYNTLFDAKDEDDLPRRDALLDELRGLYRAHGDDPAVRHPFAAGLHSSFYYFTKENDLRRRDAILGELRDLHRAHRNDPGVGDSLAKGLSQVFLEAVKKNDVLGRDAALYELRGLYQAHSDGVARTALSVGMAVALSAAHEEGDLPRRDALLQELRDMIAAHPEDSSLAELGGQLDE